MAKQTTSNKIIGRIFRFLLFVVVLLNFVIAMHAWKFTHFYDDPGLRVPQQTSMLSTMKIIFLGVKVPKKQNDSITALPHTTVNLETEDGFHLEGWHIPCKGIWQDSASQPGTATTIDHKGTMLMFHGHGSCRAALLNEAFAFLKMGYDVFMIDFRAHGKSDGEKCLVGIDEKADVKAAYDYIAGTGEKNILMYGSSMGAATIIKAIHDYPAIKPAKLILEMPFASLLDATKGKLGLMHLPKWLATPVMFWGGLLNGTWAFNYQPYKEASSIDCPVLLQWGRLDPRVTVEETREIFDNIQAPKELVIYEKAAHESLYKINPPKWLATTSAFLEK